MKNIVFVGYLTGYGGAEKSMTMIANGLSKIGYNVTLISFKDNNIVYDIDNSVDYVFIEDKYNNKLANILLRLKKLIIILNKIKPNIVISFWLQPAFFLSLISKYIGFKTIYAERGDPSDKEYTGFKGILRNITFAKTDGFVFQTQGAKNYFKQSIKNRSIVINNPVYINYSDYEISTNRSNRIVNIGRLHEQKNQELLINSFSKIENKYPEYVLEIYGDGHLKTKLENQIEYLGLKDRVKLKGTTNRILDEIKDASLFILSSDYEGMPNALMEAMSLGLPCISTDCSPGGAREIINNGVNGIICRIRNEEELSKSIMYMLDNKAEAERMAINAKQICNTHSTESILKIWKKYIEDISKYTMKG